MRSKYLFCYPVKTCNEKTFLFHLNRVIRRGFRPRVLRSDYYTAFRSTKANQFYENSQCRHESSAPYQQWQNAFERDIQTILSNVSATIHGQDFMRADTCPRSQTLDSPSQRISPCGSPGHPSATNRPHILHRRPRSHSATCCASHYKTTTAYGNST
jgi:hypothetical protein